MPASAAGERLDRFLAAAGLGLTRSRVQALMEAGLVRMDGGVVERAGRRLRGGERVVVEVPPSRPLELVPRPVEFGVIYEDDHLLVIDKPPGLVVHPGAGGEEVTLVHGLLHRCPRLSSIGGVERPGIVHRLDRETSGVMVVAKGERAHLALSSAFKERRVSKVYLALVRGRMEGLEGEMDRPIGRHPVHRKRMAVEGSGAREARTLWRVEEELPGATLLQVRIFTGRTHQIRCHMAAAGHPLLGDPLYGGPTSVVVERSRLLIPRQMLHSHRLSFRHPVTGENMEFSAPLPGDFRSILQALREGR